MNGSSLIRPLRIACPEFSIILPLKIGVKAFLILTCLRSLILLSLIRPINNLSGKPLGIILEFVVFDFKSAINSIAFF